MAEICRLYRIRGRVQGVGFRNFVQRAAQELGIEGHARNLDDGSVEVLAQGDERKFELFEGRLHAGPRWAEVRGVERSDETLRAGLNGFRIR